MAAALREAGVGAGDRVGAILPNMPEAIVSVLAAASIGAVWSSCSPDFGAQGVLDRLSQIEPKVLIACDGYYYGGKTIDIADKLAQIVAKLPTVGSVIVVPYLGRDAAVVQGLNAGMIHTGRRAQTWGDAVGSRTPGELSFTRLPFAHPLYVLFSSGTTGMPKCIVHSAGGTLMKHLCEHRMHSDVRDGDRLFYFTTLQLDDVELAGVGPRTGRDAAALRRLALPPRRQHPLGLCASRDVHPLRHVRQVHRRAQEGRADAGREPRPLERARHALDRLAAGARGVRLRLCGDQERPASRLHLRRHRHRRLLRARHSDQARVARRDPGAGARPRRRRSSTRPASP